MKLTKINIKNTNIKSVHELDLTMIMRLDE